MRTKIILGDIIAVAGRILILTILTAATVQAAPFAKRIQFEQPGGERIELWGQGDEFYAVFETLDGYTVIFDPAVKAYYYARLSADGHDLLSAGLRVGQGDPRTLGLAPHLRINPQAVKARAKARHAEWENGMNVSSRWKALKAARQKEDEARKNGAVLPAPPDATTTGSKLGLTLLIDFDDDPATVAQTNIADFCNGDSYTGYGNNGSVKKYFSDNSGGLLIYSNVVTVYIRIPNSLHPKSYYNNTAQGAGYNANLLIQDAITIMKALTNYTAEILPTFNALTVDASSNVVACNVFYAGGNGGVWAYGLWPHSWSLLYAGAQELSAGGKKVYKYQVTNIGSALEIGTFCHENGHMLCDFPDIYDYDYDSYGGAGYFSLMGYGAYDNNPVQVDAYLKRAAGWTTITELTSLSSLTASLTSSAGPEFNHFYRFQKPGVSTEYFIIENRQKSGRDALLAASGIAIWHVDELGDRDNQSIVTNTTHANYELTLVQADNLWHFQNDVNGGDAYDLYYSGNSSAAYNNQFSDSSLPQAHWWNGTAFGMTFRDFSASGATMTFLVVGNMAAPANVQASDGTYTNKVRVTWDPSSLADGYEIWRNTSDNTNTASQIGSTAGVLYDDTTATVDTMFYYWVKAVNSYATSSFSSSDSGYLWTESIPINYEKPSIFGAPYIGQTLTARNGLWQNMDQLTFTYQWQRVNNATGTIANISGETTSNHVVVAADRGTYMRIAVTATTINASSTTAYSDLVPTAKIRALPGDFNGDGIADLWFFDPFTAMWRASFTASAFAEGQFGSAGMTDVPGDYNGDGILDLGLYDSAHGMWYILFLQTGRPILSGSMFGGLTEEIQATPVPADYDGDGWTDVALYWRGYWAIIYSTLSRRVVIPPIAGSTGAPVPADYDGDGIIDLGVYDSGLWTILTALGKQWSVSFGSAAWLPAPADYDGDNISDLCIFSQTSNIWNTIYSSSGVTLTKSFGFNSGANLPRQGYYDHDIFCDPATIYYSTNGDLVIWCVTRTTDTNFAFRGQSYQKSIDDWRVSW